MNKVFWNLKFLKMGRCKFQMSDEKTWISETCEVVKKPTMKAELNFVISSAHIFTSVTGFFQKEEPLIHLLHSVLSSLVMKLLGRICKSEILKDLDLKKKLMLLFLKWIFTAIERNPVFWWGIKKLGKCLWKGQNIFLFASTKIFCWIC